MRTALYGSVCLGLLVFAPAVSAQEWAEKMFDKLDVDFGSVARGADAKMRIALTNKYKEKIEILSVEPNCKCITTKASKTSLESLDTAYIEVSLNTVSFTDKREAVITVSLGGQFSAHVKIPVHAHIRKDVVLTPGSIDFGTMGKGTALERRIQIAYAGRSDWTIRSVQNSSDYLEAKVVQTSRSAGRVGYDLIVKSKSNAPLGDLRTQLTLVTDDASTPRIPVLVEGKVEAEYTVTPDVVQFGVLQPGEKKTLNVVVRSNNRKAFGIEKVESERTADAFEVRLPHDQRVVHVLPLTFTAPAEAGTINEEFTLKITGVEDAIHFRVYGKVLATTGAARLIGR